MLREQFNQMALILVDVCESYWSHACPVFWDSVELDNV